MIQVHYFNVSYLEVKRNQNYNLEFLKFSKLKISNILDVKIARSRNLKGARFIFVTFFLSQNSLFLHYK